MTQSSPPTLDRIDAAILRVLQKDASLSQRDVAERVGLSGRMIEDMYKIMALADYEDRFVIPTTHREQVEEAYDIKGGCGFTDGNGCSTGISKGSLFGGSKRPLKMPEEVR